MYHLKIDTIQYLGICVQIMEAFDFKS